MLGHYVVKLHVHCTMRDGDARSSGSKTSAHSVHRLLNVFVVKFDPCPLVLLKRSFFYGKFAWYCKFDSVASIVVKEKHWQPATSILSLC